MPPASREPRAAGRRGGMAGQVCGLRRLRPRRPMPRWPRTGGRGPAGWRHAGAVDRTSTARWTLAPARPAASKASDGGTRPSVNGRAGAGAWRPRARPKRYSPKRPDWQAWRRVGGMAGMVRRAGCDALPMSLRSSAPVDGSSASASASADAGVGWCRACGVDASHQNGANGLSNVREGVEAGVGDHALSAGESGPFTNNVGAFRHSVKRTLCVRWLIAHRQCVSY